MSVLPDGTWQRDPHGRSGRTRGAVTGVLVLAAALGAWSCGGDAEGVDAAAPDTALQRMAEEAVPRVEASAGLTFRRAPRLARSDRDRLEAFLASEIEKQLPPERAEATAAAYARFGLLPDTVDLRALMRSLYLEQVVGYYSPEADTLFVREGVEGGTLRPVLVHELVHALQDQHMDLDSLMAARRGSNDAQSAALAALEGHATYVMLEDELARRTGGDVDLGTLDLGALLQGLDPGEMVGSSELSAAPRIVRESLVFPYTGGLTFVQAFWRARPDRPSPLGEDLPASTEQILHPDRFTGEERDAPTGVTFRRGAPDGWHEVHSDGLGEFEVRLLLEEFLTDRARARRAAAGWDGDRYRLLRDGDGREALLWATVWDDAGEADEFSRAARDALGARYGSGERAFDVRREEVDGRSVVVVEDLPSDAATAPLDEAARVELGEGPGG